MSLANMVANLLQMRKTEGGALRPRYPVAVQDEVACAAFLDLVAAAKGDAHLPADLGPLLPECRSPSGRTPVIVAALAGNATAVERLASAGYSVAEVGGVETGVYLMHEDRAPSLHAAVQCPLIPPSHYAQSAVSSGNQICAWLSPTPALRERA